jgi:hypothetical protein
MKIFPKLWGWFFAIVFLFLVVATINPNPFGNNPDSIGDESYFLTSSLSAIQKFTLPGWEFSGSGNYYGGVQTYIDTIVLVPVIGILFLFHGFSLFQTQLTVALHTGELLAGLRFVNSLLVVLCLASFFYIFKKRKIPRWLAIEFLFLVLLLYSNSLVVGFIHTAKVWVLYLLLDVSIGIIFLIQEYYLAHFNKPFIEKKKYVMLFLWAALFSLFQNYVGVVPIVLWIVYALVLKHITLRDIFDHLKKYWYLFIAFALLQISFVYRAIFVKNHTGWWDPGQVSTTTDNSVDWFHRLHDPIIYAFKSQPLVLIYLFAFCVTIGFLIAKRKSVSTDRKKLLLLLACVHPLIIYVFFHAILGFSLFPRYSLPLTIALSFSIVILLAQWRYLLMVGIGASAVMCLFINIHSISLYWKTSSDVVLTELVQKNYNNEQTLFIVDPSAWRLSLPLNPTSLQLLNARRKSMSRYQFQLEHLDAVAAQSTFKAVVVMPDSPQEEATYLEQAYKYREVWKIDTNLVCSIPEFLQGSCIVINPQSYGKTPQEINMLKDFLSFDALGNTYIMRKIQ